MLKIDKIIKNKTAHKQVADFFTLFCTPPTSTVISILFRLNVGKTFTTEELAIKSKLSEKTISKLLVDLDRKGIVNIFTTGRGNPKGYELNKAKLEVVIEVMYLLKIKAISY